MDDWHSPAINDEIVFLWDGYQYIYILPVIADANQSTDDSEVLSG